MKQDARHTGQDIPNNPLRATVWYIIKHHAIAWLANLILDKGVTKQPLALQREYGYFAV